MSEKFKIVKPALGWGLTTVQLLIEELNKKDRFKHKINGILIEYKGEIWKLERMKKGGE